MNPEVHKNGGQETFHVPKPNDLRQASESVVTEPENSYAFPQTLEGLVHEVFGTNATDTPIQEVKPRNIIDVGLRLANIGLKKHFDRTKTNQENDRLIQIGKHVKDAVGSIPHLISYLRPRDPQTPA